jgi:hypothetical protein
MSTEPPGKVCQCAVLARQRGLPGVHGFERGVDRVGVRQDVRKLTVKWTSLAMSMDSRHPFGGGAISEIVPHVDHLCRNSRSSYCGGAPFAARTYALPAGPVSKLNFS